MIHTFQDTRLAVFGPGLLGGSLLYDARRLGARELRVWARREEALDKVRAAGLADFEGTDAAAVAEGADIAVLCVPVGGMKALAQEITTALPGVSTVFTDVGSVKEMVMREVAPVFAAAGCSFIGSHPMAGSERTGFEAAREELYKDAACILTAAEDGNKEALGRLHAFWQALGCRTSELGAAEHDFAVSRISHLPHVAAVLTTLAALEPGVEVAELAAGGFRDTTRVAAGDPGMWCEILLENRDAVLAALQDFQKTVSRFTGAVESRDAGTLLAMLQEAKRLRATRYP